MTRTRQDYTGQKFNKLTVIEFDSERTTNKISYWKVKCECNYIYSASIYEIKRQRIKQCKKCSNRALSTRYTKFSDEDKLVGIKHKAFLDSANIRNYEFKLSREDVKSLIFKNCYYCGQEPNSVRKKVPKIRYNSIDRINNDIGYIIDNCVPCCRKCNTIKGAVTEKLIEILYEEIQRRRKNC